MLWFVGRKLESSGSDWYVANLEAVPATKILIFACGRLVVDDDAAANRAKWVGVKVEGAVEVIPGRQGRLED